MAPGGGLGRVKPRFVKNHTSLTSPRMMNRVQPDDPSETSRKESSDVHPKMQVPSKAATDTKVVAPTSESTANLMPPKSRLAPNIGGQNPTAGRPKKTTTNPSQTASPQAQSQRVLNHNHPVVTHNHPADSQNHPVNNHNQLTFNLSHPDIKPHQPALRSNQPAIKHSHRPLISLHSACETRKRILERKYLKPIRTT
ncbi:hypothetical protein CASFOL_042611 [Castilleja foliolosa]|uniref:Uncharacterized protein n=1 Tax=Castilleja foliolosa TaxID=1961234 RepID=A0ABD3B9I5_9LAMI